jgi:pimeloyl-ACP methyl ester carboxylesterase
MIAYDDTGTGTAVVFLHGLASRRRRWDPVVEQLSGELRCVAVDLPGHGESPDEGRDGVGAVGAVHDLVVALDLARPVVVGHSLGAVAALVYAATWPTRGVVAVDPVGLHLPTLSAALAPHRAELLDGDAVAAFWAFEEEHLLARSPSAPTIRDGLAPRGEVIRSYWRSLLDAPDVVAARQTRFAAALASISAPVVVLLADEPSDEEAAVLAAMATATVEVWAGTGHWLHLADPPRFAHRVRAWVEELGREPGDPHRCEAGTT